MSFPFCTKIYFDPTKEVQTQTSDLNSNLAAWFNAGLCPDPATATIDSDSTGMFLLRYWSTNEAAQAYIDYCQATNHCYVSSTITEVPQ